MGVGDYSFSCFREIIEKTAKKNKICGSSASRDWWWETINSIFQFTTERGQRTGSKRGGFLLNCIAYFARLMTGSPK